MDAGYYFKSYESSAVTVERQVNGDGYVIMFLSDGKAIFSDDQGSAEILNYSGQGIQYSDNFGWEYSDNSRIEWGDEIH